MDVERIRFLETVIGVDPTDVKVLTELGWQYAEYADDAWRGLSTLATAVEIAPDSIAPLFWLAKTYFHHWTDPEKVRETLERALQLKADDPACVCLYGAACNDLGDASAALVPLLAAIKVEPSWVSLSTALDEVYTAMGRLGNAIVYAKQAFRLAREFCEVSTPENESYFESCVTGRWVNKDKVARLRIRAARKYQ